MALLQNATNFRDIGGLPVRDGQIRPGIVFRSNQLATLASPDQQRFKQLGIGHIVDFRTEDELAIRPPRLAVDHQPQIHSLGISPGNPIKVAQAISAREMNAEYMNQQMRQVYRLLIERYGHTYARFFKLLLNVDEPLVFNCTVGKDRTGVAAMLLLSVLGASRETIEQDYMRTHDHIDIDHEIDRIYSHYQGKLPADTPKEWFVPIYQTKLSYLAQAFDQLEQSFGGIDGYWHAVGFDAGDRKRLVERLVAR